MPQLDFRSPRLFVDPPLSGGETVALDRNQSNYLGNVLRLEPGEIGAGVQRPRRRMAGRDLRPQAARHLTILVQTRPQDRLPDVAYVFAPLKHARLDYMVQKAVEMGASRRCSRS